MDAEEQIPKLEAEVGGISEAGGTAEVFRTAVDPGPVGAVALFVRDSGKLNSAVSRCAERTGSAKART